MDSPSIPLLREKSQKDQNQLVTTHPHRTFSTWTLSPTESEYESDLNELDEEGSESESVISVASSSSSRFSIARTPPVTDGVQLPRHVIADTDHDHDPHGPSGDGDHLEYEGFNDYDWTNRVKSSRLPHVMLRPFRNQVGGHSAIYKFTRRAVCKVRLDTLVFSLLVDILSFVLPNSHWYLEKTSFTKP